MGTNHFTNFINELEESANRLDDLLTAARRMDKNQALNKLQCIQIKPRMLSKSIATIPVVIKTISHYSIWKGNALSIHSPTKVFNKKLGRKFQLNPIINQIEEPPAKLNDDSLESIIEWVSFTDKEEKYLLQIIDTLQREIGDLKLEQNEAMEKMMDKISRLKNINK